MDFYQKLQCKVNKYTKKYPTKPHKVALKLALWNLKCVFKKLHCKTDVSSNINTFSDYWCKVINIDGNDLSSMYLKNISNFKIPQIPVDCHLYFNISRALYQNPEFKRIGLVFFMGIGDYFYATNFIEILHKQYKIPLDAYVSKNFDVNNSPLVGKCLEKNPNIANIIYFNGTSNKKQWKNYDYSECYQLKSDDTLLVPVIYEHNVMVQSRTETLCQTFNLPSPSINPLPIVYNYKTSEAIEELFEQHKKNMNKVVFIQMSARSSNYTYPYIDDVIDNLLQRGYFVISFDASRLKHKNLLVIDIKKYNINESISLVKMVKEEGIDVCIFGVMSCFASISAALKIPYICMQHFYDLCISSVYYSNMYLITSKPYRNIPSDRQYITVENSQFHTDKHKLITYNSKFIMEAFDTITNKYF